MKALQWLRRAADQGHERARNNLGVVLAKGALAESVPKHATSSDICQKSCEMRHAIEISHLRPRWAPCALRSPAAFPRHPQRRTALAKPGFGAPNCAAAAGGGGAGAENRGCEPRSGVKGGATHKQRPIYDPAPSEVLKFLHQCQDSTFPRDCSH